MKSIRRFEYTILIRQLSSFQHREFLIRFARRLFLRVVSVSSVRKLLIFAALTISLDETSLASNKKAEKLSEAIAVTALAGTMCGESDLLRRFDIPVPFDGPDYSCRDANKTNYAENLHPERPIGIERASLYVGEQIYLTFLVTRHFLSLESVLKAFKKSLDIDPLVTQSKGLDPPLRQWTSEKKSDGTVSYILNLNQKFRVILTTDLDDRFIDFVMLQEKIADIRD